MLIWFICDRSCHPPRGHFHLSIHLSPHSTLHIFCVQLKSAPFWGLQLFQMVDHSVFTSLRTHFIFFFACTGHLTNYHNWTTCLFRKGTKFYCSFMYFTRPSLFCKNPQSILVARIELQCCLLPILFLKHEQDTLRSDCKMSRLNQNKARMF